MSRQQLVSLGVLGGGVALLARQSGLVHIDFYLFGFDFRLPLVLLAFLLAGFLAGALLKSP